MAETLSLALTVNGAAVQAAQSTPADGSAVVLKVEPSGFAVEPAETDLTWLRDSKGVPGPALSDAGRTLTIAAFAAEHAGTYTVQAGTVTSNAVVLAAASKTAPGTDDDKTPKGVVEAAAGVYDEAFAKRTGTAAVWAAAFASVAVGATLLIAGVASAGSLSERGGVLAPALAAWAGALAVIGGVWMGILETRGRLSLRVSEDASRGAAPELTPELAKAVNEFARTLTFARGTVAALLIGALLLCTSVVASCNIVTTKASAATSETSTSTPGSTGATGSTGSGTSR